jgi:hypothetical protein
VFECTPPPGVQTVPVKVRLPYACGNCEQPIVRLCRDAWLPVGLDVGVLGFPTPDPDNRLKEIGGVGIAHHLQVAVKEWDYAGQRVICHCMPLYLHPSLSEEQVALAIGLLKEAGWSYDGDEAKDWAERWNSHRIPDRVKCPTGGCVHTHDAVEAAVLEVEEEDDDEDYEEAPPPKPKKKRKRKKKKKDKDAQAENEEGTGD